MPRDFDVIVFGATGVTGAQIAARVREVACEESLKWAIAGRNEQRLRRAFPDAEVVVADVGDTESLHAMCRRTRALLNVVGPYRHFGMPVVEACVAQGTNYFDVCGEPEFIERVAVEFHSRARAAGVAVVSACGFDSIPADLGTAFTQAQFREAGGVANSVESYARFQVGRSGRARINFATWWALIDSFTHVSEFRKWRKSCGLGSERVTPTGPPLKKRPTLFWSDRFNRWTTLFMGGDAAVVRRSQVGFSHADPASSPGTPAQTGHYLLLGGRATAIKTALAFMVFSFLVRFSLGRKLMLRFPGLFSWGVVSKDGPTEADLDSAAFELVFVGRGYKSASKVGGKEDWVCETRFAGPEPGYVATAIMAVHACRALMQHNDECAAHERRIGVMTPAVALWGTSLLPRLCNNGLDVSVVRSYSL